MFEVMTPYCSAHDEWLIMKRFAQFGCRNLFDYVVKDVFPGKLSYGLYRTVMYVNIINEPCHFN